LLGNIISNLILAHLLADFPLQPDFVFRQKRRGWLGVLLHTSIFFFVSLLLLLPGIMQPHIIILLVTLSVLHFWIDEAKLRIFRRHEVDNLWVFLADQAFHFTSISFCVWMYLLKDGASRGASDVRVATLPQNVTIVLIGFLVATYFGVIIAHYVEKMIFSAKYANENLRAAEKYWGILCRLCITSAFLFQSQFIFVLVSALLLQFLVTWRLKGFGKPFAAFYLTNTILSCLVGMFLWF